MHTTSYFYELLDREQRGILAYHWHPHGPSPITYPHLHVGGQTAPVGLIQAHLPTGRISLVDVVRMTISEFGVTPLRADWQSVLDRAERELPD